MLEIIIGILILVLIIFGGRIYRFFTQDQREEELEELRFEIKDFDLQLKMIAERFGISNDNFKNADNAKEMLQFRMKHLIYLGHNENELRGLSREFEEVFEARSKAVWRKYELDHNLY